LIRSGTGKWKLYDLDSKTGSFVSGTEDLGQGLAVSDGDELRFGDVSMTFHDLTEAQLAAVESQRNAPGRVSPAISM
ncbi:FHA domain-containing protein, partial [Klebsiella pneumoniae]|uniref:FHA domain-containing protein n=1 Tax=Klebsiella pneumoniae TaxID=573 RepID=UPI0025A0D13F